jgi:hypothetical protein
MVPECRHIMHHGRKCHALAMRKSAYCYHHDRLHRCPGQPRVTHRLTIPTPGSPSEITQGISKVLDALAAGQIEPRRAGRIIYGLQIALDALAGKPPIRPPRPTTSC